MERVKLVAVSGFVYSKKAVDAGASFEATPVDADYLVNTGQATREEARGNTYLRRDMVASSPTQSSAQSNEASEPAADPPERVKRKYTRRNLTAEGPAEGPAEGTEEGTAEE